MIGWARRPGLRSDDQALRSCRPESAGDSHDRNCGSVGPRFSKPVEDTVRASNGDPETVFTELTECVVMDRIRAGDEALFSAMAAADSG
jgi:hypothetical protein